MRISNPANLQPAPPDPSMKAEERRAVVLLGLLAVMVIGYFSSVAALSFFLPDYVQAPYWILAGFGELVIIERIVTGAFRQKGFLRRGTAIWLHSLAELVREAKSGTLEAIEAFKE